MLPFSTADALPTRGVGAEDMALVSKLFASVALLVVHLDGQLAAKRRPTRLERNDIDFIIYRLPWFHLTTKDADMLIDNGKDLRRPA